MKIGIVGAGHVGATAAYTFALRGIGSELVLVDRNQGLAQAHVADILHATPFSHPLHLRSGDFPALEGSALVIVAAGVAQKPGETRLELLTRNAQVFEEIIPQIVKHAPDAVLLIASNPLDIMTQVATRIAGLPEGRVFGSGTILDSARFRTLLAETYGISPGSVHAYVLGEHGDSEVLLWSGVQIAGIPLERFAEARQLPLTADMKRDIDLGVRGAAYRIIEGKGSTYYGIGAALARLGRAILHDERTVFTACAVVPEVAGVRDVALSLPRVIGRRGVEATLMPPLAGEEERLLAQSAGVIKHCVDSVGY